MFGWQNIKDPMQLTEGEPWSLLILGSSNTTG